MNLSEDTIGLLRDEAYLSLSREAIQAGLDRALAAKNEVATTRPPFGMLASKKTRETFERSMHSALTTEASLQNRLAKIKLLESSVQSKLHTALHAYLEAVSADYRLRRAVLTCIDEWEALLDGYGEQLQAFARELHRTVEVISSPHASTREGFERRMHTFAELHVAATGVDGAAALLEGAAFKFSNSAGTLFASIKMAEPPFILQVKWVDRVTRALDPEIVAEAGRVEIAVRSLVSDKLSGLHARAALARDEVDQLAATYLETYWKQLRTHAIAHYVEERDVDEVIEMLTERYITADLQRHRQKISDVRDPYETER
jgi:hypothetical protein